MPSTEDAHHAARAAKKALRSRLRARRREIAADRDRDVDRTALARHALAEVERRGGTSAPPGVTITAYQPLPAEPDVSTLVSEAYARGMRVLVPITLPDFDLDWACWTPDGPGPALGKDAVADATVAFIPGLAVDSVGTRLGQGGGCYDRALPRLPAGTPVICVLHPGEERTRADLPRESHDRGVDAVLTADGLHWVTP